MSDAHIIVLRVSSELSREDIRHWLNTVKAHAPNGIVASRNVDGRAAAIIKAKYHSKNLYIIPLSRDLTTEEMEAIIDVFSQEVYFDFEIYGSQHQVYETPEEEKPSAFKRLCALVAKAKHENWMKGKLKDGWKFGHPSKDNKTHPLLKPWHELSDDEKDIDEDHAKSMVDMMKDSGYTIGEK